MVTIDMVTAARIDENIKRPAFSLAFLFASQDFARILISEK